MNKALQKYGKSKWLNTRLSRPHKIRAAVKLNKLAALSSIGFCRLSSIASCSAPNHKKAVAMTNVVMPLREAMTENCDQKEKGL